MGAMFNVLSLGFWLLMVVVNAWSRGDLPGQVRQWRPRLPDGHTLPVLPLQDRRFSG